MNRKALWKVSVTTTSTAEEAVAELCHRILGVPASSYTDADTGRVTISVFLPEAPPWTASGARLRSGLAEIQRLGLKVGRGHVTLQRVKREDWAESWKRHFKPLEIGSALLIKPSWSKRRARSGQSVVVLDPGLGFGTGQHPTTAFCLESLVAGRDPARQQAFLDVGTGSGILALAAAKLGYSPVDALDSDPEAVGIARANARRNRLLDRIRIYRADLRRQPMRSVRKYDLICANLVSNLLLSEQKRLLGRLRKGGRLVLAGILQAEFAEVRRSYESAGLKLVSDHEEKEWRSGAFLRV